MFSKPLPGKIALVTGSEKNLGRFVAVDLAKQGANVAVHCYKNEKEAKKTLKEVKKHSRGCLVRADLTKEKEAISIFSKINQALGNPDILINLVGNFIYKPIGNVSFAEFRDCVESNLYSAFLCSKLVLPAMKNKRWGRIVNFGCVGADGGLVIREKTTPYYIAKTGVIMLTKITAHSCAGFGITVNSVSPGILTTSIVKAKTPNGKRATFKDIMNAINFILKEESAYINGANIEVAGGWRPGLK